jgi:hypothetical protein
VRLFFAKCFHLFYMIIICLDVTKILPSLTNSVSGYRSVVLTTCDDIQAELFELRSNGVKELLENYTITGIENKCKVTLSFFIVYFFFLMFLVGGGGEGGYSREILKLLIQVEHH